MEPDEPLPPPGCGGGGGGGDGGGEDAAAPVIEPRYEFCAPRYFDFALEDGGLGDGDGESWFDRAPADIASPQAAAAMAERCSTTHVAPDSLQAPSPEAEDHAAGVAERESGEFAAASGRRGSKRRKVMHGQADKVVHAATAASAEPPPQQPAAGGELSSLELHTWSSPQPAKAAKAAYASPPGSSRVTRSMARRVDTTAAAAWGLTVPREPRLETAFRTRHSLFKTAAELEAEVMAAMPCFQARPLHKRVLEGRSRLPNVPQRPPTEPEAFHFETAQRAMMYPEAMARPPEQTLQQAAHATRAAAFGSLTRPRSPHLETALRRRHIESVLPAGSTLQIVLITAAVKAIAADLQHWLGEHGRLTCWEPGGGRLKSSEELEEEVLAALPPFRARPWSKQVMNSSGEVGVPRVTKRPVTEPKVTLLPAAGEAYITHTRPRLTMPEPFDLLTDRRGEEKEAQRQELLRAAEERERQARIPCAQPLPATHDHPAVSPHFATPKNAWMYLIKKGPTKEATDPEPFDLLSVRLHEECLRQRRLAEGNQASQEAASRKFHARPNLSQRLPVFEVQKSRKPLTEVQEPRLHVDARAPVRAEFDKKVDEKQRLAEFMRAQYEAAQKAAEEKEVREMRLQMVPRARPAPSFHKAVLPERQPKRLTVPVSPAISLNARTKEQRAAAIAASKQMSLMR
eukprot:SM000040S14810  [mRNA]  locus=s40:561787:566309:+ [translate_table: standard]